MSGPRTAVIPAAGAGTRLLPATLATPKELLPVGGRPAIQWALDEALAAGVERIVLVTSHAKPTLAPYVASMIGDEVDVEVVHQVTPRGLGDAVYLAWLAARAESLAVLLPDELLIGGERLLQQLFECSESTGRSSISLLDVGPEAIGSYGCAAIAGRAGQDFLEIVGCVEKPEPGTAPSSYALSGRYVLGAEVLERLGRLAPSRRGEIELTDAIDAAARERALLGCPVLPEDGRIDVGCWRGWLEANLRLFAPLATSGTAGGVLHALR